jgi:5-(carboxyamino)imidazole ribonucleotide mutase
VTVAVLMGSDSDYPTMAPAVEMLQHFEVPHDVRVLSAHRMPDDMIAFGHAAADEGFEVLIAGAGGAAHLPGMLASVTDLPVIGVPVAIPPLDGLDSLLSIVQMPRGIPVATVAIGGAANAGLLAVRMLALADEELRGRLHRYRTDLGDEARAKNDRLPVRPGS